jgi:hypothetical protein
VSSEYKLLEAILLELCAIRCELRPRHLHSIHLLSKGIYMPGPITLTSAGQTDQTVIVGKDQFGNPWTGPIPTATYADDNAAAAAVDSTGLVTAVASGTDNVTASLTTAEGLSLSATLEFIVDIPAPVPVLTSISLEG